MHADAAPDPGPAADRPPDPSPASAPRWPVAERFVARPVLWSAGIFWGLNILAAGIPLGSTARSAYGSAVLVLSLATAAYGGWHRSLRAGKNPYLGAVARALAAAALAILPVVVVLVLVGLMLASL